MKGGVLTMSEKLNAVDAALLETIADMPGGEAKGAVNIRKDSGCASRVTTENIDIKTKINSPKLRYLKLRSNR